MSVVDASLPYASVMQERDGSNGSTAGTVTVPAGATSTAFTILTFPVSAVLNGTTKTAPLTITH